MSTLAIILVPLLSRRFIGPKLCVCGLVVNEKLSTFNFTFGKLAFAIVIELLPPVPKAVFPDWIYFPVVNNSQVVPK